MFPQNEESVRNQDPKEKKVKSKFTAWRGLFRVLDTLHIKKPLTRFFIFHPPKLSILRIILFFTSLAYTFEPQSMLDTKSDPAFEFSPKNAQAMNSNPFIKIKAFKLYREKNQKPYMTPIIWLNNQRYIISFLL